MRGLRLGGSLAVFALLAWGTSFPGIHRFDEDVTRWLQRSAPGPDWIAAVLVLLGNAEVVIPSVVVAAGLGLFRDRRSGMRGLWLAAGLTAASLLAVALKYLIVHPGPSALFQRHVLELGLHAGTPSSFPSGHTLRTTLLAWTTLRDVPWLAGVVVLSMMTALVYLGDHWASDVLGGLCLGWAVVEAREAITKVRSPSYRRD